MYPINVNFSYQHCAPCTVLGASTELHLLVFPPETLGRGYGYCCCSVAKSCPTLCNPMDCSTTGFPVLHYLQEFAQIHIHWVGDAIQPSHPLLPPSPFAFSLSQYQGLFPWVSSSSQVAKVLELQHQSFLPMNVQGWFPLGLTELILQSKGLSTVFSSTTIWKHQLFSAQPSLWSNSHNHTWLLKKPLFWLYCHLHPHFTE